MNVVRLALMEISLARCADSRPATSSACHDDAQDEEKLIAADHPAVLVLTGLTALHD